jgi:hypothetical protein
VLKKSMGRQHGVVRLDYSRRDLGRRRDREGKLGLTSIVHRKPLEEERSETRSSTSAGGMEYEETLKSSTVVRQLTDPVEDEVNNFLE